MAKKSVVESLKLLGVNFGASWEEINQSYKDLIRVWHPDRFVNQDRLKKKAEETSRELNLAMQTLRKEYDPKARPNSQQTSHTKKDWFQEKPSSHQTPPEPKFSFTIRPLMVYERWFVSLTRIAVAVLIATVGAYFLQDLQNPQHTTLIGGALALFGINSTIKHSLLLLIQRPIITVDARGIRCLFSTALSWPDVARVWSLTSGGQSALAIEYSPHYINQQSRFTQFLLSSKFFVRQAHVVVSCSGLDHHPNDVVRAIETQHTIGFSKTPPVEKQNNSQSLLWCKIIAFAAAASIMLRCVFNLETSFVELGVYVFIFALCQAYRMASGLIYLNRSVKE